MVERLCLAQIGDLQVYMPDAGLWFETFPGVRVFAYLGQYAPLIEWVNCHLDLSLLPLPLAARAVTIDFDPIAIGMGEIECFTDQVIGGSPEMITGLGQVHERASQGSTTTYHEGEVVE